MIHRNIFKFLSILIGAQLVYSIAFASFSIPNDAYRVSELDSALENAETENWPITYFLSNESTSCGIGTRASLDILKELSENSLIVYVEAGSSDLDTLPDTVKKAFVSGKAGRTLPITVISNPEADKIIEIVPFKNHNDHKALLQKTNQRLSKYSSSNPLTKFGIPAAIVLAIVMFFGVLKKP